MLLANEASELRTKYLSMTDIDSAVESYLSSTEDKEIAEWRICDRYQYAGENVNLTHHFEIDGPCIKNIRIPADPTDLIKHEERTNLLMNMNPIYMDCEKDKTRYVDSICQAVGVPLVLTSSGPTALEKETLLTSLYPLRTGAFHR